MAAYVIAEVNPTVIGHRSSVIGLRVLKAPVLLSQALIESEVNWKDE